jgi:hypothetical protein
VGTKTEWIAKAAYQPKPEDIDIDKAWSEAKVWMSNVGVTTNSKPDVKKIRDEMAKQKKGMEFVAKWDGTWIEIEAMVGGKTVDKETSQDMSAGGDQKKWRAAMGELRKFSKLVTDADLKAFDAKHPDPDKVAELKAKADSLQRDIKVRSIQIKRLQDELKPKLEELQKLLKEVKALGG